MMKINRSLKYLFLGLFVFALVSCASNPKFSGNGDLCGYVVDENNLPVEEFIISCKGQKGILKTTLTDKNGLFVFENMALGNCWIKGRKNSFVELEKSMLIFGDRSKILCFQVSSIDRALDKVEEMILYGDYEGANQLLGKIVCEKGSPSKEVLSIYKKYLEQRISTGGVEVLVEEEVKKVEGNEEKIL